MPHPAIRPSAKGGITVSFKVTARASRDRLGLMSGQADFIRLSVTAPPTDNKANEHIIRFLAGVFGVSRNSVNILSGVTSNKKRISLPVSEEIFLRAIK
jgi:uncharacterized protein